jgi:4-amino-4-deoxy-L-arabinose transferase-like glycosyltransferase
MEALNNWLTELGKDKLLLQLTRSFVMQFYPAILLLLLVFIVFFALLCLPALRIEIRRIKAKTWMALGMITLLGGLLRLFYAPHYPQVLYDEIMFLSLAKQILLKGMDAVLYISYPHSTGFIPGPIGWEVLLALAFKLFGTTDLVAFYLNTLISSLTVILLFYVAEFLCSSSRAALIAALAFAVLPAALRISGSAALEPATLFFTLLTLSALILNIRQGSFYTQNLALLLLLYAINVRQEGLVVLLPLFLSFYLLYSRVKIPWGDPSFYMRVLLSIYFLLPYFLAIFFGLVTHFYIFTGNPATLAEQIKTNYLCNWQFFLNNKFQPAVLTLFALAGFLSLKRKAGIWLSFWVLWTYVFYSANPSCDFTLRHTVDSWRISLFVTLPLLVLFGAGAEWFIARLKKPKAGYALYALMIIYMLALPVQYHNFITRQVFLTQEYLKLKRLGAFPHGKLWINCTEDAKGIINKLNLTLMAYWASGMEIKRYPEDLAQLRAALTDSAPLYFYHLGNDFTLKEVKGKFLWEDRNSFYQGVNSLAYKITR